VDANLLLVDLALACEDLWLFSQHAIVQYSMGVTLLL
jgi:hypothetical protein